MLLTMKKVKINGVEIDLDKIENPKLRRVIGERESEFLFNYGDHEDHNEKHGEHSEYDDHTEYGDHIDHPKKSHIDHGGSKRSPSHTDRMVDWDYEDDYHDANSLNY